MGREIAIIAAVAKNRVIGRDGHIPWDLPEDRRHFRELTEGHMIVMGRRTYEEIGHPLPGRITYLVSSTSRVEEENCHTVTSLEEVLRREPDRKIFVCGGAMLYQEALPLADRLYLTELSWEEEGDTCFPPIDESIFYETGRETKNRYTKGRYAEGRYAEGRYAFVTYKRQSRE